MNVLRKLTSEESVAHGFGNKKNHYWKCVFGLFDLLLYESSYGAYLINRWSWGCQLQGLMDASAAEIGPRMGMIATRDEGT